MKKGEEAARQPAVADPHFEYPVDRNLPHPSSSSPRA